MQGRIIKVISNDYTVSDGVKNITCKARGVFRNKKITPLAGDIVIIDENKKIIEEILERKNELFRPPIANIDIALVVMSLTEPDFNINLLDKLLSIIEFNNIKPMICLTKKDLLKDDSILEKANYYSKIGYEIIFNNEVDKLKKVLSKKVIILTGQTGVGKSTLLNKLDSNLNLNTSEISKALGRGKHTTRNIEFYKVDDILIADTPGFSLIDFKEMNKEDIRDNFIEFNEYKDKCKYRDCIHINEDDCFIKEKVKKGEILKDRYNNYVSFIKEKENNYESFSINSKRN